jgi:hypothetical protein
MSGIKNSTPAQRVTAPGEQGQVAHPHSAGSTPGPTKGAFLPLDGRPARLRLVRRLPALIDAARGVAWRVDGVTDVYFTMAVQSTACPCARARCVMRAWFFSSSPPSVKADGQLILLPLSNWQWQLEWRIFSGLQGTNHTSTLLIFDYSYRFNTTVRVVGVLCIHKSPI